LTQPIHAQSIVRLRRRGGIDGWHSAAQKVK
jgi:hypothetical protein